MRPSNVAEGRGGGLLTCWVSSLPVFHGDLFEHVEYDIQVRYILRGSLPVGVTFPAPQSESYNVHIHNIGYPVGVAIGKPQKPTS